jgi:uncharacterized membrane protein
MNSVLTRQSASANQVKLESLLTKEILLMVVPNALSIPAAASFLRVILLELLVSLSVPNYAGSSRVLLIKDKLAEPNSLYSTTSVLAAPASSESTKNTTRDSLEEK